MPLNTLPDKTVERLSQYRRLLMNCEQNGKEHIFSHELAHLLHITSVQVRRDIMLIGYSGTLRQGYRVESLIQRISQIIDSEGVQKIAVIGVGNLGKAVMGYFNSETSKLQIVAGFDSDPAKANKTYAGIPCYHISELSDRIQEHGITAAILSIPGDAAAQVSEELVKAGIRGILNFSPKALNLPDNVYVEEADIITMLEKVSYFVKHS